MPEDDKQTFGSMLKKIGKYTTSRNMMAHAFFLPAQNEPAIMFMTARAKGTFNTPSLVWTKEDFAREYEKIDAFTENVLQLTVRLEHAQFSAERLDLPTKIVGSSARPSAHQTGPFRMKAPAGLKRGAQPFGH
jgi:hypothetical protein